MGGIAPMGGAVTGNGCSGNYIGVGSDGTTALATDRQRRHRVLQRATARIGGGRRGGAIVIAHNSAVRHHRDRRHGLDPRQQHLRQQHAGIDLGRPGSSGQRPGDADTGPNNPQNYPVIGSVVSTGGNTTVTGTPAQQPQYHLPVEFFSSPSGDASGHGEGRPGSAPPR